MDAGWRRLPSLVLKGSPQSYRSASETSRHRGPRGPRDSRCHARAWGLGAPGSSRHRGPRGPRNSRCHARAWRFGAPGSSRHRGPRGPRNSRCHPRAWRFGAPASSRHRGPRGPRNAGCHARAWRLGAPGSRATRNGCRLAPSFIPRAQGVSAELPPCFRNQPASRPERAAKPPNPMSLGCSVSRPRTRASLPPVHTARPERDCPECRQPPVPDAVGHGWIGRGIRASRTGPGDPERRWLREQ